MTVAGKVIVAVGANVWTAEPTIVVKPVPSVLPCTDRVWVLASQVAGSLSTTWSMLVLAPRSTWAHCGKALLALSQ